MRFAIGLTLLSSSLLLLTGCSSTLTANNAAKTVAEPAKTAKAAKAAARPKKKEAPVPVAMPAFDALKGKGLYYFDDNKGSRFYVTDTIAENGLYDVKEEFKRGEPHGFTWGTGAAAILRKGVALDPQAIEGVSLAKDRHIIVHLRSNDMSRMKGKKRSEDPSGLDLHMTLEAYDMSDLPIGPYLVTRTNRTTPAGYLIGSRHTFPKGSIGYRATLWVNSDEVIVPTKNAFTGSGSIEDFSKRFTKEIPYCLRYIPGRNATPLGLKFEEPIVKKTDKDSKGRLVEVAQKGSAELYPVQKGTIFCNRDDERSLATARWSLRYVNGSRVLEFDFPDDIRAEDFGVPRTHRDALKVAFAEERVLENGKTVRKLVPARVWRANRRITDYQWRFNETAAEAVREALEATKEARREWDAKHATKKTKK